MSPGCILYKVLYYQEWDGQTDRRMDRQSDDVIDDNAPSRVLTLLV